MEVPSNVKVGHRFSLSNDRGTIKYIGPVADTKGIWLGVEWDDPSRGKHDGVSKDTRYFHCRQAGSPASFIRFNPKLAFGTSFLKALSSKYLPPLTSNTTSEESIEKPKYSRKNLAEIEIETPNFDGVIKRAARLAKLREAGLGGWKQAPDPERPGKNIEADSGESVAVAFGEEEKEGDIRKTCPSITWFDLSRSLIPSWDGLALICVELERLESLLLHFNRFEKITSQIPESWCSSFQKVKDLRLDGTLIDWSEVLHLERAFPSLELLQLGHNGIQRLGASSSVSTEEQKRPPFKNLKILNLEGNELSDWQDLVGELSAIPQLQRLILSSNHLKTIDKPSKEILDQVKEAPFPSLEHVSLLENPLQNWSDLEALDCWLKVGRKSINSTTETISSSISTGKQEHGLKSLAIGGKAIKVGSELEPRDFRLIVIARLGALDYFNGGLIRPVERKDSELFYLSQVAAENLSGEKLNELHPRFEELSKIYGAPQAPKPPDKDDGTLRKKLIELKVFSSDLPSFNLSKPQLPTDQSPLKVKLLFSTPIRLMKMKVAKVLSIKPQAIKKVFVFLSSEPSSDEKISSEMVSFELEDERRDLNYFEVREQDSILVLL